MAVSQYEKDRIARVAAREARKKGGVQKVSNKPAKKSLTPREQEQKDINAYKARFKPGAKKDTRTLRDIANYGKPDSTATSGGSKAVRKIDPNFKGATTATRTKGGDLVNKLRRNRPKYLRTSN